MRYGIWGKIFIVMMAVFIFSPMAGHGASLTKPVTLAWEQYGLDFVAPAGGSTIPLNSWKLYQKDSASGPVTAAIAVPYVPANLSPTTNAQGYRTYTYGPMSITATGAAGTTVQKCWHVTALGNDTTPPSETVPSNTACENFILPADPIQPPGAPSRLQVKP